MTLIMSVCANKRPESGNEKLFHIDFCIQSTIISAEFPLQEVTEFS